MSQTDLLEAAGLSAERARAIVAEATDGADDGELYLEYLQSEGLSWDNGRLKGASFNTDQGFGLRSIAGEAAGYAHSGEISEAALKRAASAVIMAKSGHAATVSTAPRRTNTKLYTDADPIAAPVFGDKVELLQEIDAYCRALDPSVVQVSCTVSASQKHIAILRADGQRYDDCLLYTSPSPRDA